MPHRELVSGLVGFRVAAVCGLTLLIVGGNGPVVRAQAVHLRVNQVGYQTQGPKLGIAFSSRPLAATFRVVEANGATPAEAGTPNQEGPPTRVGTGIRGQAKGGRVVFEGRSRSIAGANWGRFGSFSELDFSSFSQVGVFSIEMGGTKSVAFRIGEDAFHALPDTLLEFMREQRCGDSPWLNTQCHQWDGRTAYGPLAKGSFLDARGGWHDAADLLKYLLTSGNATAQMLLAWELSREGQRGQAEAWLGDHFTAMGRPGTNGVPDVLDEARWGLDWLLKLHPAPDQLYHQVADDRDHCGWRLPQNEQADYGWGKGGARVVYNADGQPQGLGRYKSESTGVANLAGRYAAAMALAYQVWKDDPAQGDFARRCRQAGVEVYRLGRAREGVQQGNSYGAPYRYGETTWADDMEWGAAELFRATGEAGYLDEAKHYARLAGSESWMGREQTGHYQYYPFFNVGHYRLHGLVNLPFRKLLENWYREGLERCRRAAQKNPFGIGVPFIWCSNNLLVALVTQCALYERMTGDRSYREFASRHRDWLLGRNPWGTVMFTGIGKVSPQHPHLMTTRLTGRYVAGALVDGPVYERIFKSLKGVSITEPDPLADFQDSRAVYHDDLLDYSTNEPTMDGTASAILMWAVLNGARDSAL